MLQRVYLLLLFVTCSLAYHEKYELDIPVADFGEPVATQTLVDHHLFVNTLDGPPLSVNYTPPEQDFTHVTLGIEYIVGGRQFDRLSHVRINGVEVWRPSTLEPNAEVNSTTLYGAKWTKDVSTFAPLFKKSGVVELELGNTYDNTYNGVFNTTLVAKFYNQEPEQTQEETWFYNDQPNAVYPVITGDQDVPPTAQGMLNQLPRNTTRAALSIFASGNGNEEFWYTHDLMANDTGNNLGPTRLVQVWVNGQLAGLANPFPVIYTGGMSVLTWREILGLKVMDVPSYIIDISPFLPTLWDSDTVVEVTVTNGYDNNPVDDGWLVSASCLTWQQSGVKGSGSQKPGAWLNTSLARTLTDATWIAGYTHSLTTTAWLDFEGGNMGSGLVSWNQEVELANFQSSTETSVSLAQDGSQYSIYNWGGPWGETHHRYSQYPMVIEFSSGPTAIDRKYIVDTSQGLNIKLSQRALADLDRPIFGFSDTWVQASLPEGEYERHAMATNSTLTFDSVDKSPFSSGTYQKGTYEEPPLPLSGVFKALLAVIESKSPKDVLNSIPKLLSAVGDLAFAAYSDVLSKKFIQKHSA